MQIPQAIHYNGQKVIENNLQNALAKESAREQTWRAGATSESTANGSNARTNTFHLKATSTHMNMNMDTPKVRKSSLTTKHGQLAA